MRANPIKKTVLGCALAAVLLGAAGCGGDGDDKASEKESSSASASAGADGADLSGVPDVVAEVNDEEISKEEFTRTYESQFQQASMQAQSTGQPVDQDQLKKQIAESMVGTELLTQEAEKRGLEASDDDVDQEVTDLAKQNGLKSADQFFAQMDKQGMDEETVRTEVTNQIEIEQLLAQEGGNAKPTEAELRKLYDQAKQQQATGGQQGAIPPFEKVRPQLVQQVTTEKQNSAAQKLVTSLRKQADVTVNL